MIAPGSSLAVVIASALTLGLHLLVPTQVFPSDDGATASCDCQCNASADFRAEDETDSKLVSGQVESQSGSEWYRPALGGSCLVFGAAKWWVREIEPRVGRARRYHNRGQ